MRNKWYPSNGSPIEGARTYFKGEIKKFDGTVATRCCYLIPISNEWST